MDGGAFQNLCDAYLSYKGYNYYGKQLNALVESDTGVSSAGIS